MMYTYDILAIIFIGISHVVIYIQLIDYQRFSWKSLFTLGLFLTVFLLIVVTTTGYPEFNTIVMMLFLLGLGLLKQKDGLSFTQSLYFALFSLFFVTLAKTLIIEILYQLLLQSSFNVYIWSTSLLHLIASCIILLTLFLLRKKTSKLACFIVRGPLYYVSYILLAIGTLAILTLTTPAISLLNYVNQEFGDVSYILSLLLFFILLMIFFISSHLSKEQLIQEQKRNADQELLDYTEKLEIMHEELASFRHDYVNLLLSLDQGVRARDMQQVEQVYNKVIKPTSASINHKELELVKLARIKSSEVKSVMSVKVIDAHQKNISVLLDIPNPIDSLRMPLADFIRTISIILDNAIEESAVSHKREMHIAFFEVGDEQKFIVKNSCLHKQIDLSMIYQKNYTNKEKQKSDRGYGLFSLKRIIDHIPHVMIETVFEYPYFTQILTVKKQ